MDPGTGRQRRSADMARKSRFRPSPSHGYRQCPGQTPRNCGVSAACVHGPRFAGKRVVVQAVCSEPVSAEFPVKQGINREFSQNHPIIRPIGPLTHSYRRSSGSNSLNIGTGNSFSGTGNLIRGTGNYLGGSGNRPTVPAAASIRGQDLNLRPSGYEYWSAILHNAAKGALKLACCFCRIFLRSNFQSKT